MSRSSGEKQRRYPPAVESSPSKTGSNPVEPARRPLPTRQRRMDVPRPRSRSPRRRVKLGVPKNPVTSSPGFRRPQSRALRDPQARKCTRRLLPELNPPRVYRAVSPVSLQTASRPFELSLQSTLQLSLTVLVRYRTRASI